LAPNALDEGSGLGVKTSLLLLVLSVGKALTACTRGVPVFAPADDVSDELEAESQHRVQPERVLRQQTFVVPQGHSNSVIGHEPDGGPAYLVGLLVLCALRYLGRPVGAPCG
jgi:hypothetical protein